MKATVILVLVALATRAHAEPLNYAALADDTNSVSVTTGAEHGLVVAVGYARMLRLDDRPLVVGGDVTLAAGGLDVADSRARVQVSAPIVELGRWKLVGGIAAVAATTSNDLAQMVGLGADASIIAGRYTGRWFAAAELGFDCALATHISISDAYRMTVYDGARDGWYADAAGLFRAGVQAGVSFGGNDLTLRTGILRDTAGNPTLIPFYATLGYARRW